MQLYLFIFLNDRKVLTAYHWYTEQRLKPTIILATFPHINLWVVGTCKEDPLLYKASLLKHQPRLMYYFDVLFIRNEFIT